MILEVILWFCDYAVPPQECEPHHGMVITTQAATSSGVTNLLNFIGVQQVHYYILSGWTVYYLAQEIIPLPVQLM